MERLVQKLVMSEINPYCKIEGIPDEFYVANSEEASLEQLQVVQEALKKLYEYEQMEEQGLIMKLPCKIGDTVYQLINSHIYEYKVIGIYFDIFQNKWMYEVSYQIGLEWFKTMCDFDAFGKSKTVFLTKEEAEKALERLECAE